MLQFGGHHLALKHHIRRQQGRTDTDPHGRAAGGLRTERQDDSTSRTESDKALALLQSLDATRRKQAILSYTVGDLALGPRQDGKKISPEGLKASAMNAKQQTMLLDVIAQWAGIMNEDSGAARMAQLKTDLNETWLAWSGPSDGEAGKNITAYYRIQGPHLVIEYAPQNDEPGNHVHTMYRHPTNDYGSVITSAR
jgi:hypothetical protein